MFEDMMEMFDTYKARAVDNYTKGKLFIDTALVTDSEQDYETAVEHPKYDDGDMIIVEMYDTKEEAQAGHDKWVGVMTADTLPERLVDVSSCGISNLLDIIEGNGWRQMPEM